MKPDDMVLVRRDDLEEALQRWIPEWSETSGDQPFARLCVAVTSEAAVVEYGGWHYGVIREDGRVWGCGTGEDGRARQRRRLHYPVIRGACLIAPVSGLADNPKETP